MADERRILSLVEGDKTYSLSFYEVSLANCGAYAYTQFSITCTKNAGSWDSTTFDISEEESYRILDLLAEQFLENYIRRYFGFIVFTDAVQYGGKEHVPAPSRETSRYVKQFATFDLVQWLIAKKQWAFFRGPVVNNLGYTHQDEGQVPHQDGHCITCWIGVPNKEALRSMSWEVYLPDGWAEQVEQNKDGKVSKDAEEFVRNEANTFKYGSPFLVDHKA